jgi:hypothetical protein
MSEERSPEPRRRPSRPRGEPTSVSRITEFGRLLARGQKSFGEIHVDEFWPDAMVCTFSEHEDL